MILTSMQYVVWESEYLRHAQAAALGGGGAYMVEQLFGSGQFEAVPAQTVLPPATSAVVSECAYRAFLKVPQAGEPKANFSNIRQATAGSAGIDLITQAAVEFKFPLEVKIVPSQYKGPLPSGLVGLILPRSSAHKQGCFVVPGVIDSDYTGTLMIQVWVILPQLLPQYSSIAQLLLIPYDIPSPGIGERGNAGFGSTSPSVGKGTKSGTVFVLGT
uniref:dUTPase-like domain-containing protein n=1 Tax=Naja naja TaxID=35670 RepID=A0A8C6Y6H6_NAJNA